MGSYNYLGYAENEGPRIDAIREDLPKYGVGLGSAPNELGKLCLATVTLLLFDSPLLVLSLIVFTICLALSLVIRLINCLVDICLGTFDKFIELEAQVAQFLGVEDSVVIGMGFATNALCLPCLFGPGSLVISDQNNHASLILGCKLSGAKVQVFKHNGKLSVCLSLR